MNRKENSIEPYENELYQLSKTKWVKLTKSPVVVERRFKKDVLVLEW